MIIKIIFLFFCSFTLARSPFSHGSTLLGQYLLCQYLARLQPLSLPLRPLSDPYSALKSALTSETTSVCLPRYFWEITCQVELKWENKKKKKLLQDRNLATAIPREFTMQWISQTRIWRHWCWALCIWLAVFFLHKEKWLVLECFEMLLERKRSMLPHIRDI